MCGCGRYQVLTTRLRRTQVYVEADARMDTFEVEGGEKRTALNLLQREYP